MSESIRNPVESQAGEEDKKNQQWPQNVVVMRHGDRIDAAEPLWSAHADRPWDPPLTSTGKIRAWTTGKRLRSIGFPIHRVVVSPFLRCLQTAAEVITALCCVVDEEIHILSMETSSGAIIDPTRVKVNIEYGLCEVLCMEAMRITGPPKDGMWFPNVSELEALLPFGTLDHSVDCLYQQLPSWEEPLAAARERYQRVIEALADKFPQENLLLVTHGEAVGVSVSSYLNGAVVYEVEYCAHSHLQRQEIGGETTVHGHIQSGDLKESFYMGQAKGSKSFIESNQWPPEESSPLLRATMNSYYETVIRIGKQLSQLIALSLDLDEHYFETNGSMDVPMAVMVLLHYPGELGVDDKDKYGVSAHSDYGMITLLATDGVPGLEICREKDRIPQLWERVPHVEGALVINLGDMLERWTNCLYRSTLHRVISVGKERYSVALLLHPKADFVIESLESCCSDACPPRFPPIRCSDYLKERLKSTYPDNKLE